MSKQNNLTDFLTDVANAIRTKKGTSLPINPQNFSSEIASISGGGSGDVGDVTPGEGQHLVTFIDYDGTVLKKEAVNDGESATPPATVPEHEHLTFNKWVGNYSNVTRDRIVGAHYNSADGNTWMHHSKGEYVRLYFTCSSELTIDWGDGKTETTTSGGTFIHRYTDNASHWISLSGGTAIVFNGKSTSIINIDSILIGLNLTSISNSAFKLCYSLSSIVIPDAVTSIGSSAFNNCYSLASIVIPDRVTSIGSEAFNNCYSLASVVIPDAVTSINYGVFYNCYSLVSIVIPDAVTSINDSVFYSCYSLSSIVIPDAVTSIGSSAFNNCYSLASIVIPDRVTSISSSAFNNCYSLASIVIPDRVTSIRGSAFNNCRSISSVVIPNGVTSIDSSAFYGCLFLQYAYIKATTPPTLSSTNAIPATIVSIYVPDESIAAYQAATNWSTFASKIKGISEMPTE